MSEPEFKSQNAAIVEDETKLARVVAGLLIEAAMADGKIDERPRWPLLSGWSQ